MIYEIFVLFFFYFSAEAGNISQGMLKDIMF